MKLLWVGTLAFLLVSCGLDTKVNTFESSNSNSSFAPPDYSPENLILSIRSASLLLVRRLPTNEEFEQASSGSEGYQTVIRKYLNSNAFLNTMRVYLNQSFGFSGTVDLNNNTIDANEPQNLILYIIKNDLSYKTALTADYCVGNNLEKKARCPTFQNSVRNLQNYGAGVVTTQAWLALKKTAYNFRLVSETHRHFSCEEYPDSVAPGMAVSQIAGSHKTFNQTSGQTPTCYSCHKTMNPRATVFYNFNVNGIFSSNRSGTTMRDNGDLSQISDLMEGNATPTYFDEEAGTPAEINTSRDYGEVITKSSRFEVCTVQRFFNYTFNRDLLDPLPEGAEYLITQAKEKDFKVKEIFFDVLTSGAFINH